VVMGLGLNLPGRKRAIWVKRGVSHTFFFDFTFVILYVNFGPGSKHSTFYFGDSVFSPGKRFVPH